MNPFGVHFSQIKVSNLLRVDEKGTILEGTGLLNTAAFAIHSTIHKMRPDVVAAAHTHSPMGRAWSTLGRNLGTITQDACAFYEDHSLYNDFQGVVLELEEGARIGAALGNNKAVILQNHGLLTVGQTVEAAVWWYIAMERCCQVELTARATGLTPHEIPAEPARQAKSVVGSPMAGFFQFQPLYARILKEEPDLLL